MSLENLEKNEELLEGLTEKDLNFPEKDKKSRRKKIKNDFRVIKNKKKLAKEIYGNDYYENDGRYNKGKIYCSCAMCRSGKYEDCIRKNKKDKEFIKSQLKDIEEESLYTEENN